MPLSPDSRIAFFYFVSAMSVGAVNGFAGLWLHSRGMTAGQIGVIFAVPIIGIVLAGVPVGRLADRARDWRHVIVGGALISAVVPFGLLVVDDFAGLLVVWTLAVVTQVAIIPVVDAAALRRSRREGRDFGILYAWKTVGYLTTVLGTGFLVRAFSITAFLPAYLGLSLLRGLFALPLPPFRAAPSTEPRSQMLWVRSANSSALLPLIGWALVHCTHSILNGFLGVLWIGRGVTPVMVGALIAFSGVVETGVFVAFKTLIRRFKPTTLILISCLAGVVRWCGFALSPPLEVLFLLQVLHGLTYAVGFMACTNLIADLAAEDVAAEAQSFFSILQSGVSVAALVGFGAVAGAFGAQAFFGCALLAGLGALLVGFVMRRGTGAGVNE